MKSYHLLINTKPNEIYLNFVLLRLQTVSLVTPNSEKPFRFESNFITKFLNLLTLYHIELWFFLQSLSFLLNCHVENIDSKNQMCLPVTPLVARLVVLTLL